MKNLSFHHYKAKDKIVNEIEPFGLIKRAGILSIKKSLHSQQKKQNEQDTQEYLLFRIDSSYYALPSTEVQEIIIAKKEEKRVAILVDEVFDIENFKKQKMEYLQKKASLFGFYNFNSHVVALVNLDFYLDKVTQKKQQKTAQNGSATKSEFLLFYIANEHYGIDMRFVRHVTEVQELAKTEASSLVNNSVVKFLATWNHMAIAVLDVAQLLEKELHNPKDAQVIFIEKDKEFVGFLVDEVEDIVYLNDEAIHKDETNENTIIDGAIVYENKAIATLNENFLVSKLS